jgi:hypothetical protein
VDYSKLSGVEARLLLVYRDNPQASNKEAMELSGIDRYNHLCTARKNLRERDFLTTEKPSKAMPKPVVKETPQDKVGRVMFAYRQAFRTQITPAQAQQMLLFTGADTVIDTIKQVATRDVKQPYPYILAILKTPAPKQRANAKPTPPNVDGLVDDEMLPVTPEFLAKQDRLKKVKFSEWD